MKRFTRRDVPAGAALTVVALVLVATVVTGRDKSAAPPPAVVGPTVVSRTPPARDGPLVSAEDLDLERLKRPKKESSPQALFENRSWNVAAFAPAAPGLAAQRPTPPPAPGAPPLPFNYLGRMVDRGALVVFLGKGPDAVSARVGACL